MNQDINDDRVNGFLLIDKEEDITSYDVIRKLKRVLPRKQKIGHAGTLDPFATGLLVILLGKATKLNNTFQIVKKGYEVKAEFGYETDTQDPTGEKTLIAEPDAEIQTELMIEHQLDKFTGAIKQIPPNYSAKRINGKRAYDLARAGEEFEITPKDVFVNEFNILKYEWPFVTFNAVVSSGTYLRTLVVDLAHELDTYATAVELRRTFIGEHSVEDALDSKEIENTSNILELVLPI